MGSWPGPVMKTSLVGPRILVNDHAVAARVRTLTDFWRLYSIGDYRPEIAERIWEFVGRTGSS